MSRSRAGEAGMPAVAGVAVVLFAIWRAFVPLGGPTHGIGGWLYDGLEVGASFLCLAAGARPGPRRRPALWLGAGLLAWSTGDIVTSVESAFGPVPTPSVADLFYLVSYPLLLSGVTLIVRRRVGRMTAVMWLDAAAAATGAGAVWALLVVPILSQLHDLTQIGFAVSVAYPAGDLVLLAVVVAGTALQGRQSAQWVLIATAFVVNCLGDTANVVGGSNPVGGYLNAIAWPIAIMLVAVAAWRQPATSVAAGPDDEPTFLLPGAAAALALGIVAASQVRQLPDVATGLALATLAAVGVRLTSSFAELRSLTRHRRHQAVTDELTGLGNRRRLFEVLDAHVGPHERAGDVALVFIDLNRFKEVNDSFGHAAGDLLLQQLGPRLRSAIRSSDLLVRLGGDELAVVLIATEAGVAVDVARRIQGQLQAPFELGPASVEISASVGIAYAPKDAHTPLELVRCADVAMYRAKQTNAAFAVYNPGIDDANDRLRLVDELRSAIERRELQLHYQVQQAADGSVVGVEALCRWPHPRLGWIPPVDFLPLAEEAGLMPDLTDLVLDEALAQTRAWCEEGRQVTVSVNVSVTNLLEPDFGTRVERLLHSHGLPGEILVLEITEVVFIADFEAARPAVEGLRRLGVGVSIDDFGAGMTSLASLGALVVDELKLDRSFVTGIAASPRDRSLVAATIELAHALGLRVVAEGIEDASTSEILAQCGCDVQQGYFLGRPAPAPELAGALTPALPLPPLAPVAPVARRVEGDTVAV